MKTKTRLTVSLAILTVLAAATLGIAAQGTSRIGAGARYHASDHATFMEVPYDGDISYGLVYEYHESIACWQLGVQYAPDVGTNGIDSVISPELNLLYKDKAWRGGVGAVASYIEGDVKSDWSDIYWQFVLGLEMPVGGLSLQVLGYYVFEDWGDLSDFEFDDLEVGAFLTFAF